MRRYFTTKTRRPIFRNRNREIVELNRNLNQEHEFNAQKLGLGFRITSATILQRYPVVLPDHEPWELDYYKIKAKMHFRRIDLLEKRLEGSLARDLIPEPEDEIQELVGTLPPSIKSKITINDINNDMRSYERDLTNSLYLIVKRNRSDNSWQFPQGKLRENETLRENAERVLDRAIGKIKRWYVGNAPIGYQCYAYPPELQKKRNEYGTKVFYYRAQHIQGNMKLETRLYTDYAWINRKQVFEYFENNNTANYMKELLLD